MSRGQTWGNDEVKALIDIWSDDQIAQLLVSSHKNNDIFEVFSERMLAVGFDRTVNQCRIKVKKLRQKYIKVRDSLRKGGSCSGEERDKFPWYDHLDVILGTRPTSSPKHVVESFQYETHHTAAAAAPQTGNGDADLESDRSADQIKVELNPDDDESTPSTSTAAATARLDPGKSAPRWAIPGAQSRKRKAKADGTDGALEVFVKQMSRMDEADRERQDRESAAFDRFMRLQQEAEERRFSAMQEQQQATSQLFLQMMGTFARAILPQSPTPPAPQWMPTAPTMPTHAWPLSDPPAAPVTRPHNQPPVPTAHHHHHNPAEAPMDPLDNPAAPMDPLDHPQAPIDYPQSTPKEEPAGEDWEGSATESSCCSSDREGASSMKTRSEQEPDGSEAQSCKESAQRSTHEERDIETSRADLKKHLTLSDVKGKPCVCEWSGKPLDLFQRGDQILAVNDLHTCSVEEFQMYLGKLLKNEVRLTALRLHTAAPLQTTHNSTL